MEIMEGARRSSICCGYVYPSADNNGTCECHCLHTQTHAHALANMFTNIYMHIQILSHACHTQTNLPVDSLKTQG